MTATTPPLLHGFGVRYDLPAPLALYLYAAGGVVVTRLVGAGVVPPPSLPLVPTDLPQPTVTASSTAAIVQPIRLTVITSWS